MGFLYFDKGFVIFYCNNCFDCDFDIFYYDIVVCFIGSMFFIELEFEVFVDDVDYVCSDWGVERWFGVV